MDKSTLLKTLLDSGLVLPEDYAAHIEEMAEGFVYKYTRMILDGKISAYNVSIDQFNYDQSNVMMRNLYGVLKDLKLLPQKSVLKITNYALQHSTKIGTWSNSYYNYKCYPYALGKTYNLQPGGLSGSVFNLGMSVSAMADVVLADLATEGYWGYKTTVQPTVLPDSYFRLIAIRKDTSNVDYHFIKAYYNNISVWVHKPSTTQPLQWNYTSPGAVIWDNECVDNGVVIAPTVTYESTIYYILYKHSSDPGYQPQAFGLDY